MRVVIVGAGEVGFSLAQKLIEENHDVIIIEQDEEKAAKADSELDAMVIRGNGARPQVLAKAGVQQGGNVDLLIGCTDRDEVNILACWIAKRAGVKRVISRVRSLEFTDTQAWAHEFGIDLMVSPERSVAREIEELLFVQAASYAGELIREQVGIYAFRVAPDSPVVNTTLSDVRKRYSKLRSIIVFIERGDEGFVPSGDSRFCEGDLCYLVCMRDDLPFVESLLQPKKKRPLHRVFIVGGGKIGFQLASRLEHNPNFIDVRLIDMDKEKCERLAQELKKTVVLCASADDEEFLKQEGVESVDGFVCTTANDETNILIAVLGKALGAKKSIAVVRHKTYLNMDRYLPVDSLVNPNEALISMMLRFVRYSEQATSLSIIDKIGAEMLEVPVPADSQTIGKPLRELNLPKGVVIAFIERNGEIFVPDGDAVLQANDTVVLFASSGLVSKALNILEG